MAEINCLVIGYGSIGKRHVDILEKLNYSVSIVSRRKIKKNNVFNNINNALNAEKFDYIVIANETVEHKATLEKILNLNFNNKILVEKPLFDNYYEVGYANANNIFIGYNLRFHPLLQKLKILLDKEEIISSQVYVGQYLPNWRPNTDYRKSYSAFKEKGGGVIRDLSHEIDYMTWLLGDLTHLTAKGGKFSKLDINSDDHFGIIAISEKCQLITIQLNYIDRLNKRELIVNTNQNTYVLDFIKGELRYKDQTESIKLEKNYMYEKMHKSIMNNDFQNCCTFNDGLKIMKYISLAEKLSRELKWVKI